MIRSISRSVSFLLSLALMPGFAGAAGNTGGGGGNAAGVLPVGLPAGRNDSDTFNTAELVVTSTLGMLQSQCGGYCIIGVCIHIAWGWSWRKGPYLYTIVSPRLRHPVPDLLVSSYNHVGGEPYLEWRASVGALMSLAAGPGALNIAGGRANPVRLDQHQSESFKDVDIIGHPLAILPQILDTSGSMQFPKSSAAFAEPPPFKAPTVPNGPGPVVSLAGGNNQGGGNNPGGVDVKEMLKSALTGVVATGMDLILAQYKAAMLVLQALSIVDDVKQAAAYFTAVKDLVDVASQAAEIATRSSIWGNLVNPRFQTPRMICPNNVRPLQPYYLSFVDAFWWRAGYPVTDGPFSGSNKTSTILNPFSSDTLPTTANPLNPLSEQWGNLYPREGAINQVHDAKTASVLAWRGMDVLQNSLPGRKSGRRVGIELPDFDPGKGGSVADPRWQMIYPEVLSCETTPYYPPKNLLQEFIEPNVFGGYAWNYYRTYTCCSNQKGRFVRAFDFPAPLCISLADVESGAEAAIKAQSGNQGP